jgi:HEAT repeat protein
MNGSLHAPLRIAVAAFAALAPFARADDSAPRPAAPAPAPVPTVTHAFWRLGDEELSGWLLAKTKEGAVAIALDDATLRTVERERTLRTLSSEERPVREVPSLPLAFGLSADDLGLRERCQDLLEAQKELAVPALGAALDLDSAEARRRALEILTRQPAPKLSAAVRRRLGDGDVRVRKQALRAYAELAPEDLFERTQWLLEHDDAVAVQHEAIVQLGRMRDMRGIDVLFDNLDGCDERSLRLVTFDALRRLTAHDLGRDEEAWRAWWANHRKELIGSDEPPPATSPRRRARRVAQR